MLRDTTRFLTQFLAQPNLIGAIAPSSRYLAHAMLDDVDWGQVRSVVEYGPGTGAFTRHLMPRLPGGANFFAIEINSQFARALREGIPQLTVYEESVADVARLCRECGVDQVDAIISGLPWAAFSDELQTELLDATCDVLRPGGHFATFAYLQGILLPAGQRFRRKLNTYFSQVTVSRTVWRNVPPALVYRCRR